MSFLSLIRAAFIAAYGLIGFSTAHALDFFISLGQGYTHYDATDLNRVLILMEKTTQQHGFNNYEVNQFDGHPQSALLLGVSHKGWHFGIEAEFWVEEFSQNDVPFDLANAERLERITCDDLRNPAYTVTELAGCVQAKERFNFIPLTFQVSRDIWRGRWGGFALGYGLGIMAGSAHVEMSTDYIGEGAIPDDKVRFEVWPGVNPLQKFFVDAEFKPWRYTGLTFRGGYRLSELEGFSLRSQKGQSRVFSSVFPGAKPDANLYIVSYSADPEQDQLFIGTEAEAKQQQVGRFHLVNGDFTGWFVQLKLNLYMGL